MRNDDQHEMGLLPSQTLAHVVAQVQAADGPRGQTYRVVPRVSGRDNWTVSADVIITAANGIEHQLSLTISDTAGSTWQVPDAAQDFGPRPRAGDTPS